MRKHPTRASLSRLRDGAFEIASGNDVRGWGAVLATDERIGTTDDLILDTAAADVRYLEIAVDPKTAGRERHVLIPVDCCRIDTADHLVVLSGMTREEFVTLPESDPANLKADYDDTYRSRLSTAYPPRRTTHSARGLSIRQRLPHTPEGRVSSERKQQASGVRDEEAETHVDHRRNARAVTSTLLFTFSDGEVAVQRMEPRQRHSVEIERDTESELRPSLADSSLVIEHRWRRRIDVAMWVIWAILALVSIRIWRHPPRSVV